MSLKMMLCVLLFQGTELEMVLIESSDNSHHSNRTNTASSTSRIHDSHLVHSGHGDGLHSQGPGVVHIQVINTKVNKYTHRHTNKHLTQHIEIRNDNSIDKFISY